jgi:hypothetical protein
VRSCLSVRCFVAAASLVCVVSFSFAAVPAEARIGRAAERCQRRITQAGTALVNRQLSDVGRCTGAVLRCIETAPDDPTCLPTAAERCERVLARLSLRELRLARTIAARCRNVGFAELAGSDGLGFAGLIDACSVRPDDPEPGVVLAGCIARRVRCGGERLLAIAAPRTRELIRIAGVPRNVAELECLTDQGGSGAGDPDVGDAVMQCARSTARANARLVGRTLGGYAECVRAIVPCVGPRAADPACVAQATADCDRVFARITEAGAALRRALTAVCADERVPFASLAAGDGADLDAIADRCAALAIDELDALPAYVACLARHESCETAALIALLAPRASELFARVGGVLDTSSCPAIDHEPRPTPTPVDSATPTATMVGPTRTPHPGETATPTPTATGPTPTLTPTASRTPTSTPTRTVRPTPTRTPIPVCGNGIIEGDEQCDGGDLDDNDCDFLCEDEPDPEGTLKCAPNCRYDFGNCKGVNCAPP